jgi:Zn-dependent protease
MGGGWWVHRMYEIGGPILLVSWAFWVIFSITLHELAHGWTALWQGDHTPRLYKRMTMNPLVHMGTMSLIMFAVIGIAWGAMPVNPSAFRWGRKGDILVSAAGPAMNILLAIIAVIGASIAVAFATEQNPIGHNAYTFFRIGAVLNIVLAILNLIPAPPLDGSKILMGLSRTYNRWMHHPNAPMFGLALLLAVFLTPLGSFIFSTGFLLADSGVAGLSSLLNPAE